jgi:NAD(P)H-nitrite reductase large subunit
MTTSVPVVFACGDVASHRTGNFSIWPQAMAQGKVAGANAAGGAASYGGVVPQNLLNVAGTSVLAAGEVGAEGGSGRGGGGRGGGGRGDGAGGGDLADETGRSEVFRLDREQGKYAKFVFRGETIVGVMLIGEPALAQPAARAVQAGHTVQGLDAVPSAGQFDYVVERITRS